MFESAKRVDLPFGSAWVMYGNDPGLKTEDLRAFDSMNVFGIQALRGVGIGASLFREHFVGNNKDQIDKYTFLEKIDHFPTLLDVNIQILPSLTPGKPVVVRSSEAMESGGTGIYDSVFFVPTGDIHEDSKQLLSAEKTVYKSYFSPRARSYRDGINGDFGMGLLIQPVIGDKYDMHFMPAFSGVMTVIKGKPAMRLVIGLGTKAVDLDEAIVLEGDSITTNNVAASLPKLRLVHAIHLSTGNIELLSLNEQLYQLVLKQLPKLQALIDAYKQLDAPYYLEFSIDESDAGAYIVQAAPANPHDSDVEFDESVGRILYEGTDTVNEGKVNGRGIVIALPGGGYGKDGLSILQAFNSQNAGHLLVVPDMLFTQVHGQSLIDLSHFSNAHGIVEVQIPRQTDPYGSLANLITIDHTNKGGTHFAELCSRRDILFLGAPMAQEGADVQLLGPKTESLMRGIDFWDVPYKMTITSDGRGRVEVVGNASQWRYSARELDSWIDELRSVGNDLAKPEIGGDEDRFSEIGKAFLSVAYECIAKSMFEGRWAFLHFNPFQFVDQVDMKDIPKLITDIELVMKNFFFLESYDDYEQYRNYREEESPEDVFPLEAYLKEAVAMLRERLSQEPGSLI